MGFEHTIKCAHIKANGKRCQSPALRKGKYCVFHSRARQQTRRILRKNAQARFVAPVLEDARSIQLALSQVVEMLAAGKMEPKVAGPILYALQTASNNLRLPEFVGEGQRDEVNKSLTEYLLRHLGIPFDDEDLWRQELEDMRRERRYGPSEAATKRNELEGKVTDGGEAAGG
jgi:hypothetical protein